MAAPQTDTRRVSMSLSQRSNLSRAIGPYPVGVDHHGIDAMDEAAQSSNPERVAEDLRPIVGRAQVFARLAVNLIH
jgi:hypothetical protein